MAADVRALLSKFFRKTDPPHLTIRVVQNRAAISATAELFYWKLQALLR